MNRSISMNFLCIFLWILAGFKSSPYSSRRMLYNFLCILYITVISIQNSLEKQGKSNERGSQAFCAVPHLRTPRTPGHQDTEILLEVKVILSKINLSVLFISPHLRTPRTPGHQDTEILLEVKVILSKMHVSVLLINQWNIRNFWSIDQFLWISYVFSYEFWLDLNVVRIVVGRCYSIYWMSYILLTFSYKIG
jgi:hypothetical protein